MSKRSSAARSCNRGSLELNQDQLHALVARSVERLQGGGVLQLLIDTKNALYVPIRNSIAHSLCSIKHDTDAKDFHLPQLSNQALDRLRCIITTCQLVAANNNLHFSVQCALEISVKEGQQRPFKSRVHEGVTEESARKKLSFLMGDLQSAREKRVAHGNEREVENLYKGKYTRKRIAEKAAKLIFQLSSFRGAEADLIATVVRDAFVRNNLGDILVGVVDADALFAPCDDSAADRQLVSVLLSTDKDAFTIASVASQPQTVCLQVHSGKVDTALAGAAGATVPVPVALKTIKVLDRRAAGASFVLLSFPFLQQNFPGLPVNVLKGILTSRYSEACRLGDGAGLKRKHTLLLVFASLLAAVGMENAPPLFLEVETGQKLPSNRQVVDMCGRALLVLLKDKATTLKEALLKRDARRATRSKVLRDLHHNDAASARFLHSVCIAIFAKARLQRQDGALFPLLWGLCGTTQDACIVDDHVADWYMPPDVAQCMDAPSLQQRLEPVAGWWRECFCGATGAKTILFDPDKEYQVPYHRVPKELTSEHYGPMKMDTTEDAVAVGDKFQNGKSFVLDFSVAVARLEEWGEEHTAAAPKGKNLSQGRHQSAAKAATSAVPKPHNERSVFEPGKEVPNRSLVLGRLHPDLPQRQRDLALTSPTELEQRLLAGGVELARFLKGAYRQRNMLQAFCLDMAVRMAAAGGGGLGASPAFHCAVLQRLKSLHAPERTRVQPERARRAPAPMLQLFDGGATLGGVSWTVPGAPQLFDALFWQALEGLDEPELVEAAESLGSVEWVSFPQRVARMVFVPMRTKVLNGIVEAIMLLTGTRNKRLVLKLYQLGEARAATADLNNVDEEGTEEEVDEEYRPSEDEEDESEDQSEEEQEADGEEAVDEIASLREGKEQWDKGDKLVETLVAVANANLPACSDTRPKTLAEVFALFTAAEFKKPAPGTGDSPYPGRAQVLFAMLETLRQSGCLPEKDWSWVPRPRKAARIRLSDTWMREKLCMVRSTGTGDGSTNQNGGVYQTSSKTWAPIELFKSWFPGIAPLLKNVLPYLPIMRRSKDGLQPVARDHLVHVVEKFVDVTGVVLDDSSVRVMGSRRWDEVRLGPARNFERIKLQLKERQMAGKNNSLADVMTRSDAEAQAMREEYAVAQKNGKRFLRKNNFMRGPILSSDFARTFPGRANVDALLGMICNAADAGMRNLFAWIEHCCGICKPFRLTAGVANQKQGKFSRRTEKRAVVAKARAAFDAKGDAEVASAVGSVAAVPVAGPPEAAAAAEDLLAPGGESVEKRRAVGSGAAPVGAVAPVPLEQKCGPCRKAGGSSKCDGKSPCSRCVRSGNQCEAFEGKPRLSRGIDAGRSEIPKHMRSAAAPVATAAAAAVPPVPLVPPVPPVPPLPAAVAGAPPPPAETASQRMDRLRLAQDLDEQVERKSNTARRDGKVPSPLFDMPPEFEAKTVVRLSLEENKRNLAFEVVSELLKRTCLQTEFKQQVIVIMGDDVKKGFSARGAAQQDLKPIYDMLCDHFLVVLAPEYNGSQRCDLCFGFTKFVRAASYREKVCKGCPHYEPRPLDEHTSRPGDPEPLEHRKDNKFAFRCDRDTSGSVNNITGTVFRMLHDGLASPAFAPDNAKDVLRPKRTE